MAMVDPGTQEAMAEHGAWETFMAGSPPQKNFLGRLFISGGRFGGVVARGSGEPDGTSRDSGEPDGTSRGSGEPDRASRGTGGRWRGAGTVGRRRGAGTGGRSVGTASRGCSGSADSRGHSGSANSWGCSGCANYNKLDGTSGNDGELDGTSGETGKSLRGGTCAELERPQEGAVLEQAQEGAVLEQAQEGAVLEQAQEGAVLEQACRRRGKPAKLPRILGEREISVGKGDEAGGDFHLREGGFVRSSLLSRCTGVPGTKRRGTSFTHFI